MILPRMDVVELVLSIGFGLRILRRKNRTFARLE